MTISIGALGASDSAHAPRPQPQVGTPAPCPVTLPNQKAPPGFRAGAHYYGNDHLWVVLGPTGTTGIPPDRQRPDGASTMKFPWGRGRDVSGPFTVTGRRLDAPAPPLQATIPEGYGETGFQATDLLFPAPGCWEVTGREGTASLTFVTLVVPVNVCRTPVAAGEIATRVSRRASGHVGSNWSRGHLPTPASPTDQPVDWCDG